MKIVTALGADRETGVRARILAERWAELNRFQRRLQRSVATVPGASTAAPDVPTDIDRGRLLLLGRLRSPANQRRLGGADRSSVLPGGRSTNYHPRPSAVLRNAPFTLPPAPTYFSGRDAEILRIGAACARDGAPGIAPVILLQGMPGAGKSALALHMAHRLAADYPDGCLFADFGAAGAGTGEILDRLLRQLGIDGDMMPAALPDRIGLYRTITHTRRILIVLDNVRRSDEAEPLIPPSSGSRVLITSRRRLPALDGAVTITVPPLADEAALLLFTAVAAPPDEFNPADRSVNDVVRACAGLPLALRIAAGNYRTNSQLTMTGLATRLKPALSDIAVLSDGERSVARTFASACADMPPTALRMLLALASHPGPAITRAAAGWLIGASGEDLTTGLRRLCEDNLLSTDSRGRFVFHDLIRTYALQRADDVRSRTDRDDILRRLIAGYVSTAHRADSLLSPRRYRPELPPAPEPAADADLHTPAQARAWFDDEIANMAAVCRTAFDNGLDRDCWTLAYLMRSYLFLVRPMEVWLATHRVALLAAQRAGDGFAEATTRNNLGLASILQGRHAAAEEQYRAALAIFLEISDRHGAAVTLGHLAWLRYETGHFRAALDRALNALAFYDEARDLRGQAITLRTVALSRAGLRLIDAAVDDLRRALDLCAEVGSSMDLDASMAWNCLGEIRHETGSHTQAAMAFIRGIRAARRCGSRFEEARGWDGLSRVAVDTGRPLTGQLFEDRSLMLMA